MVDQVNHSVQPMSASDQKENPPLTFTTSSSWSPSSGNVVNVPAPSSHNSMQNAFSAAAALAQTHAEAAKSAPQHHYQLISTGAPHLPLQQQTQSGPTTAVIPTAPLHKQFDIPIHMLQPPSGVAAPSCYHLAANRVIETPPIFRNRNLRSGKWTTEEEAYADILIDLFEKGHIDEKNGCTLRSFLSRKLHCAPMRISKKYAGKGIGKMVFLSKTNITGIDGIGSFSSNANTTRLREAEAIFLKGVYPEVALVCVCLLYYSTSPLESRRACAHPYLFLPLSAVPYPSSHRYGAICASGTSSK
jgi:hypothetical protein